MWVGITSPTSRASRPRTTTNSNGSVMQFDLPDSGVLFHAFAASHCGPHHVSYAVAEGGQPAPESDLDFVHIAGQMKYLLYEFGQGLEVHSHLGLPLLAQRSSLDDSEEEIKRGGGTTISRRIFESGEPYEELEKQKLKELNDSLSRKHVAVIPWLVLSHAGSLTPISYAFCRRRSMTSSRPEKALSSTVSGDRRHFPSPTPRNSRRSW